MWGKSAHDFGVQLDRNCQRFTYSQTFWSLTKKRFLSIFPDQPGTMGAETEPVEQTGGGVVQRRDSQLKQVADSIIGLQRMVSKVGADWSAEDINALLDPSSMVATTLSDTQEREETSELEQKTEIERAPTDARKVRRDGTR